MTDPLFEKDDEANTPLAPEEREGLIPTYITTKAELNAAEQENISEADEWAFGSRRGSIVDFAALIGLHRRMLRRVWKWAGKIRQTERNIGIPAYQVEVALHQLIGDVRYWIEHKTFEPDEIALRFHHRLVAIHPFPNGNGRHARLAADALAVELGQPRFTWGSANLVDVNETRKAYVRALQAADGHDMGPLLAFGRS